MGRSRDGRASGFTLVELLVVIGVITVLIALVLPVLNRAREQARIVACASNLRQIYAAMVVYANESRQMLPYPDDFAPQNGAIAMLDRGMMDFTQGTLVPYLSRDVAVRQAMFLCPSDGPDRVAGDLEGRPTSNPRNFSYCFSTELHNDGVGIRRSYAGVRWSQIRRPANKIMLYERHLPYYSYTYPADANAPHQNPPVFVLLTNRHDGQGNQCFADGHIELLDPNIFASPNVYGPGIFVPTEAWAHYVDFTIDR